MKNLQTRIIFIAIFIFLISMVVPFYIYCKHFGSWTYSAKFTDWTDFSSYFNGISAPIITFANLGFFVYLTIRVAKLQEGYTIHQMRNDAYFDMVSNYNLFSNNYLMISDPEKKLAIIFAFQNQINLFPEHMQHLFSFTHQDVELINLKSALQKLHANTILIKDENTNSATDKDGPLFQEAVIQAGEFLKKMQAKVLTPI